ncbi:HWE histidine kinase domain-containing protein [Hyphomicrobium sp. 99]|uniref:HWE histidine kinase domain-containing protein n=1 Tax=Hyphomicrobium sp. 99 TaxID=1163419 RepID=UPI0005F7E597|nr:HWE histidine kinase domain-containing protein [Hyphomicrobium sp. 99]
MVRLVDNLIERVFPRLRRRPYFAYPIGIAIFAVAAMARMGLSRWLQDNVPFLTFFLAVLLAALIAGTGPALVVTGASLIFSWYFFLPGPGWTLDATTFVALASFTILSCLIVAVVHLLNRKVEGLMNERARNEALFQDSALGELQLEQLNIELRHRLKNTFAVIGGLVSQSARYSRDVDSFAQSLSGRLSAMGNAMDLIATRSFLGASLKELIAETLKPLVPPGAKRLDMGGPDTVIPGDVASALALTLHELGTNAIKYGAWSDKRGAVSVKWTLSKMDEDELSFELVWDERGGPRVSAPERRGLGTTLIDSGFPSAKVEREFNEEGVRCRIVAVLKQATTRRTRGRAPSLS